MKKLICMSLATALAAAFAADGAPSPAAPAADGKQQKKYAKWTPEARQRYIQKKLGGWILDTRKLRGKVSVVNAAGDAVKDEWLEGAMNTLKRDLFINTEVVKGTFDLKNPDAKGNVTVFVVDDPALPITLVAPEAHWSVVNMAKLKCDKPAFNASRIGKAVTRALVPLLGGADSGYPGCIMHNLKAVEDLDQFVSSELPIDVLERMRKNLDTVGMGEYVRTTYQAAVRQGWAPAPTNEFQKAIWNQIHTLPTKPITIEPETK